MSPCLGRDKNVFVPSVQLAPTVSVPVDGAFSPGERPVPWRRAVAGCFDGLLTAAAAELSAPRDGVDAAVADQVLDHLRNQIADIAVRTVVRKLGQARASGELAAPTPAARFREAIDRLTAATTDLFAEYPELRRLLTGMRDGTVAAHRELVDRWAADRARIGEVLLAGSDPGPLVSVAPSGDAHAGGRSVAVLTFADGRKVVYKPRPLALHAHFNDIVDWLNARTGLGIRTVRVSPRQGYGWMEFVAHRPCPAPDDVERFYRRLGALLALLYVVDGTDFHFENLIAAADQPVLVDVETLFHPAAAERSVIRDDPAAAALRDSVLRTALLPLLAIGEHGVVDLSGLGGDNAATLPVSVVDWADAGLDTMRLNRRPAAMRGADNRPRLGGATIEPRDHRASILAGFGAAYDAIVDGRADLLDPDGLLGRCRADQTRFVARPTQLYVTLLDEATHPDLLRDAGTRHQFFAALAADNPDDLAYTRLLPHEIADLDRGEVPLFHTSPGSWDVRAASDTVVTDVFAATGLACAEQKIRDLGEVDRRLQEWLVTAALATRPQPVSHCSAARARCRTATTPRDPQRLLTPAIRIADGIVAQCLKDGERVNWIGVEPVDDAHWAVLPTGAGLPHGYLGIALFLAEMSRITGADRYLTLAADVVRPLPRLLDAWTTHPSMARALGAGFAGLGGIVYALGRLAEFGVGADGLPAAITLAARLAVDPLATPEPGFADGDAGGLAAMLTVQSHPAARRLATRYADRLADLVTGDAAVRRQEVGFSHGWSGIAWALHRYVRAGPGTSRHHAAMRVAANRAMSSSPGDNHGWCSGAAGPTLVRWAATTGPDPEESRGMAVRPVLRDLSLCHGEFGAVEPLVWRASEGDATAAEVLRGRAAHLIDIVEREDLVCGTPDDVSSPGLISGLAGVGYGLLRLGFGGAVPSVLLMEPASHCDPFAPTP